MRYYLRLIILILTFIGFHPFFVLHAQESIKLIVIDPGHGGQDGGCTAEHIKEKELTLLIGEAIGKKIESTIRGINVVYTRSTDTFVPLRERIGIANKLNADLFISIHVNSLAVGEASGAESYVLGIETEDEHLEIVIRENASIAFEKEGLEEYTKFDLQAPEARIIMSAYQQNYSDKSIRFANHLQEVIDQNTKLKDRGVRQAPFVVLKMATMPAILFECGFITDMDDRNYLRSYEGIDKIAISFVQAIENYILQYEQANSTEANIFAPSSSLPINVSNENANLQWLEEGAFQLKIQVLTSLNKPIQKQDPIWQDFKDLEEVRELEVFNYLTGNFSSLREAKAVLQTIRKTGYPGAYLVAIRHGERISLK
jgi:N-acetylmuramoyl-L-alanine amidase